MEELVRIAKQYLQQTDWLAIRAADGGTPVRDEVKIRRAECREFISINDANNVAKEETLALMHSVFYTADSIDVALINLSAEMQKKVTARNAVIDAEAAADRIALEEASQTIE